MVSEEFSKVLIFDLMGPLAHFRKFYTNSSSLTYSFPPRTVVSGLIAGMLGYQRDSYYEKLGLENCKIGVSVQKRVRKLMETVNYISTKDFSFKKILKGEIERTQVPLEILMPVDSKTLRFRIFFWNKNEEIYSDLKRRLKEKAFVYPPYLGLTEFIAEVDFVCEGEVHGPLQLEKHVTIKSVTDKKCISELMISSDIARMYYTEKAPVAFKENREILKSATYIFEATNNLEAKVREGAIYQITYQEKGSSKKEYIAFME